jgi:8-oxo-dGTP diphosphatase
MNDKLTRVTAAILVHNDRILIAQRRDPDNLAGKWEFPGGKIEHNETPQQCLIREMKEEFDIDVVIGKFFDESVYHYESGKIQLLAYHTTWKRGRFSLNAHAAIRWVSLNQMQEIEFAPADIPIAEKLQHRTLPI